MIDEEIEADEMRNALSAIANEMQQLHKESVTTNHCATEEILNKVIKYKTCLNFRKIQIKNLRSNLKTACAVAKTMSSAKAIETASLSKHLDIARSQCLDLEQQQTEKNEIINNLNTENHALRDQLKFFNNAIQLGYQELQEIRNERVENVSTLEKFKYIIVCCEQYHTDHCYEHERCIRLEQKNKFLSTKMIIMENNLEAATSELRFLHTWIKPYKEKRDALMKPRHCFGLVRSEYKLGSRQKSFTNPTMTKIELKNCLSLTNIKDLDLMAHLKKVKILLNDQDDMIRDLKSLSKIINVDETYWTIHFF